MVSWESFQWLVGSLPISLVCKILSNKLENMLINNFFFFLYRNYYGYKITELFGMALYDAYTPIKQDFSTNNSMYGAMYNGNIMKAATCNEDLDRMDANKEDFTWTVDWFKVDDG